MAYEDPVVYEDEEIAEFKIIYNNCTQLSGTHNPDETQDDVKKLILDETGIAVGCFDTWGTDTWAVITGVRK